MLSAGRASSKIRFAACEPQGQSLRFFIDSHSPLDNSVSIGTDGALSSNHMDMVDGMWLTSLIHKGWRLDPAAVSSEDILRMAAINGAPALWFLTAFPS